MKIKGDRVCLSKVTMEDLNFISELECNKDIWLFEESVETDKDMVKAIFHENLKSSHHFDFVITIVTDEEIKPIGIVQIRSYVEHRSSWELGFGILPEYQGYGYGYEAAKLLLHFAFEKLDAHKIVGMCNSNNQKSINLMEKLGMRREGIFKQEVKWNREWHDQFFYSILECEWKTE